MAYRKYKKRTYRRTKKYVPKGYVKPSIMQSTSYLANKAFEGVKFLKGIINSELLKKDNATGSFNVPNSSQPVNLLNNLGQGDTISGRTGNSVLMKHLSIRGYINFVGSPSASVVKMWIIIDTQQVADTAPLFADIFSNNDVISLLNTSNVGRFKIIKSQLFINDSSVTQKQFNCDIPLNIHARYNGTGTTDINKNGVYIIFTSNQAVAAPCPTAGYVSRISYYDN